MNIRLFNRGYTLRRFTEGVEVRGYMSSGFEDLTVSIHVHPSGGDRISDREGAGEVLAEYLEGHGEVEIRISNREDGTKADMLWFNNHWYECVSCEHYFHTLLNHYNYRFALIPKLEEGSKAEFVPPLTQEGGGS